ncbi:MAG: ATP-binding protein, partial [Pyramidobacter sp.]|nr:ATP-binding protein [Pyramidobacter sp.]
MRIRRDLYLNKLISKKHNGLIKVVTGLRRCGKSYLLFTLFKEHLLENGVHPEQIVEIAFDSFENEELRNPHRLYALLKEKINDSRPYYILLDEVQLLDDFEAVLNSLSRHANVDLYVTGSNAKFLSKDIITEFRGRGDEVHLWPLTFAEYVSAYGGERADAWRDYLIYGGLPLIFSFAEPEQKSDFLKNLFVETYISDIVGRNRIRNKDELEELLNTLSSSMGSLTNPSKLSATFKSVKNKAVSPMTIKKYIDCLLDSFL